MKKFFFLIVLNLSLAFSATNNFINPPEIKAGMELESKTRMAGNEMYQFKLKVLSVLKGVEVGDSSQWLVMAEVDDELIRKTGVLAGMSGSPVYYQERLLGAIAMTDSFQKGTIVLIRPIAAMMKIVDYDGKDEILPNSGMAQEIKTPVIASGSLFLSAKEADSILGESYQFVQGGVVGDSGNSPKEDDRFSPGDACMISLVSGDINMGALGTVTYADKDYILAFGHPMMNLGKTSLPLHLARVDALVPKMDLSYKVGSMGKEVGSIVEDRNTGIMGRYGVFTQKTQMKLSFNSPTLNKDFHFQIIKNNSFIQKISPFLILNVIRSYESDNQKNMYLKYKVDVSLEERKDPIEYEGIVSFPDLEVSIQAIALVNKILTPMVEVFKNPYKGVNVRSIDVKLDMDYGNKVARITDAYIEREVYKPGENVKVFFEMEEYQSKKKFQKVVSFLLPKNLSKGQHTLMYDSGPSFYANNFNNLGDAVSNFEGLIRSVSDERFSSNNLVLSLHSPSGSNSLLGKASKYNRLPEVYYQHFLNARYKASNDPIIQVYPLEDALIATPYENQIFQGFNIDIEE